MTLLVLIMIINIGIYVVLSYFKFIHKDYSELEIEREKSFVFLFGIIVLIIYFLTHQSMIFSLLNS